MTVNEWISLNSRNIYDASKNITKNDPLHEDLAHEIIISFVEDKRATELVSSGAAMYYIARMMINNWNSSTSPFFTKFKKFNIITNDIETTYNLSDEQETPYRYSDEMIECLDEALKDLHWYKKYILTSKVIDNKKISTLHKETNIPAVSLYRNFGQTKAALKETILNNMRKNTLNQDI